ncbi:MAG: hypothetical protein IRY86_05465 [Thermorudis peleae]|nr:hypothetical protein [Thermorudis peleae]
MDETRIDFLSPYARGVHAPDVGDRIRLLYCPVCGFECNHPIRVVVNRGGVVDVIEGWTDPPQRFQTFPTDSGSSIWLEFAGECGHLWALHFQFHEGVTVVVEEARGTDSGGALFAEFWRD